MELETESGTAWRVIGSTPFSVKFECVHNAGAQRAGERRRQHGLDDHHRQNMQRLEARTFNTAISTRRSRTGC
jgi:hypothetical protein